MSYPRLYLWYSEQDGFTVGAKNFAKFGLKRVAGETWPKTKAGLEQAQARARELQQKDKAGKLMEFSEWKSLRSPNMPAVVRYWIQPNGGYFFSQYIDIGYITIIPTPEQEKSAVEIIEYA